jgi:tricorn protease
MPRFVLLAALVLFGVPRSACAEEEARLLRFPTIHGNQIVFSYAGDLYSVDAAGGVARKLTSHPGFEMFPRFSPDGKWLAFTGQYDGNTEVYCMAAQGGVPRRLTYTATLQRDDVSDRMGPNNLVMGWKNDGKHIVFRSRMHSFNDFLGQLYTVSVDGGPAEALPLPRGGFCSFAADDSKLVYNRVFREFRTWKRYRGGMADDLWLHDFKTRQTERLTSTDAQEIIPMWKGNKVYFLSDRDEVKRMNLYVHDLATRETNRLTNFTEFDIKFPSLGDGAIVFEYGGWIYRLPFGSDRPEKVPVRILEDQVNGRGGLVNVGRNVTNFEISPDGKRALFGARGDVFTVPAKTGVTRNLTRSAGIHERNSKWSPDGKWIAYVSDASGEDEIWIKPPDGNGAARQLTTGGDTYKYGLLWSPDSKKILWSDRKQRLQFVEVESKVVKLVEQAKAFEMQDFAWAPDSQWIAYGKPEVEGMPKIYVYSLEQNKSYEATDGWYASSQPEFSGDGKYLFFVSNRDFQPIYSRTEWNHAYQDMSRLYLVTLAKETANPLLPPNDEVPAVRKDEPRKEGTPIMVDVDGLKDRILALPVPVSNYGNLQSVGGALYYIRGSTFALFDLNERREIGLGSVGGFEISADKKKMILAKDGNYGIVDLPRGPVSFENLNLSGMEMQLDRHAEWNQIFHECWRQMRDFFYDPGLHGVDWPAMRKKYEPLVKHVNHRADLTYVIGEMISELNAGHAYVGGGEMPTAARIPMGLLGADLRRDERTRYFQIGKILKGASWDAGLRSPLAEIGVDAHEGDFVIEVNGQPTNELVDIQEALINAAGRQVIVKLNKEPKKEGAREVVVTPTSDESRLRYYAWVQGNIKKVSEATGGKVGYLHVPDMLQTGLNEFVKHFYPQLQKKALIIDMRGNGGGNVSPQLIERLRRDLAMVSIARNGMPQTQPGNTFLGPMVCLMNEFSASDGDLFPYQFKHYKLGKLIGKRSWGGVVGIRGTLPLLDGGYLNKPEFARYDLEGRQWIIEGVGVEPDIVIDNDPAREFAGVDDQLNKAIEVILEELKTKEKILPPPPPGPKKDK